MGTVPRTVPGVVRKATWNAIVLSNLDVIAGRIRVVTWDMIAKVRVPVFPNPSRVASSIPMPTVVRAATTGGSCGSTFRATFGVSREGTCGWAGSAATDCLTSGAAVIESGDE